MVEWIDVKDRLPDKYGDYLTCDEKNNFHVFFYHPAQQFPFGIEPWHPAYYMPTHWAHLPEPPTRRADNDKGTASSI